MLALALAITHATIPGAVLSRFPRGSVARSQYLSTHYRSLRSLPPLVPSSSHHPLLVSHYVTIVVPPSPGMIRPFRNPTPPLAPPWTPRMGSPTIVHRAADASWIARGSHSPYHAPRTRRFRCSSLPDSVCDSLSTLYLPLGVERSYGITNLIPET